MKNYELIPVKDKDAFFFSVVENQTKHSFNFYFEEDAKKCLSFLEAGGAFNGFTPAFMFIELPAMLTKSKDTIDKSFATELAGE
jgi:hypothetical protein